MRKRNLFIIVFTVTVCILVISYFINNTKEVLHTFQRWRNDINMSNTLGLSGKGVKIALIDTGVDINHPDLKNADISCISIEGVGFKDNSEHGTAMAGIIIGNSTSSEGIQGIAPKAELISIDFSDENSDEPKRLIIAIEKAIQNDVDIINISMGIDEDTQELHEVIKRAYEQGIIIVAAAGNGESGEVLYPAKYSEVISVGAMDKDGSALYRNISMEEITVMAPGKNVYTTYSSKDNEDQYISADGSSPATAIVSGIVALVLEKNSDLKSDSLLNYFSKNKRNRRNKNS